jgi:hypothetical protein
MSQIPRPSHRSFADPSDEIYRENPAKFPETPTGPARLKN